MHESNRIELKSELTDSLEKEVIAFLNYRDGGIIYIGVDDKSHKAIEIKEIDTLQLKIKDRIKHNITPSTMGLFDVAIETRDGKQIIKINLASGPEKPYYLAKMGMSTKGCFIRVGSASEPMSMRMIEDLFASRIRNSIGTIRSRNQELTFEQLKIYVTIQRVIRVYKQILAICLQIISSMLQQHLRHASGTLTDNL